MKDIKIVIGANYGDEGKGLMTRHFCLEAKKNGLNPIVIFHNGTAQRGHTVDYTSTFRHVYHHFGSGTGDGVPTYFADSFLIHPMEFRREYCNELIPFDITPPLAYCDPAAKVITPFDMLVDHCTLEHIAKEREENEFEHGTCGFGSWCAIEDRLIIDNSEFTIQRFLDSLKCGMYEILMDKIWKECLVILASRGVDIEKSKYSHLLKNRSHIINNFRNDLLFFESHVKFIEFDRFYLTSNFNSFIFENGQGLGLDVNNGTEWHTTSNTGILNPYNMLKDYSNFTAEACYVTRSYITRHGQGEFENEINKNKINAKMIDITNKPNDFQGKLRYGIMESNQVFNRIKNDYNIASADERFIKKISITHTNEFTSEMVGNYESNNPYEVIKKY